MKDPYQVFGIPEDADEAAVRRRYLELVREHTPEQSPQRFAEIRAAYEQLRDPQIRLKSEVLEIRDDDSLEDIISDVLTKLKGRRIPVETLLSVGDK